MKSIPSLIAIFGALAIAAHSYAVILVDQSPDATGANTNPGRSDVLGSNSSGINYAERIIFGFDVLITGMDIYSDTSVASLGQTVVVKRWLEHVSGTPEPFFQILFDDTVSALDRVGIATSGTPTNTRVFVDFGINSFILRYDTPMWIGTSGNNSQLGLIGLTGPNAPGDSSMARFDDNRFLGFIRQGDMAMRIHGRQILAPDTGSTALLLGAGLLGLAAVRCRMGRN